MTTYARAVAGLTRPDLAEARRALDRIYGPEAARVWSDLLRAARLDGSETEPGAIDRLLVVMRSAAPVTALCGEALSIRVASSDRLVRAQALMRSAAS
jgi:hypothetical protein